MLSLKRIRISMSSSNLLTLSIACSICSSIRAMTHTASTRLKSLTNKSKLAPSCSRTTLGCSSLKPSLVYNRSLRTRYRYRSSKCTSSRPLSLAKLLSFKIPSIQHQCKLKLSNRLDNCFTKILIKASFSNLAWVSQSISNPSLTKGVNNLTPWVCQ